MGRSSLWSRTAPVKSSSVGSSNPPPAPSGAHGSAPPAAADACHVSSPPPPPPGSDRPDGCHVDDADVSLAGGAPQYAAGMGEDCWWCWCG